MWMIAWRNLLRQRRRTLLTASAMATGVALCMAMIALSDGIYAQLFDVMVTQKLGHVQLHHPDYPGRRQMYDTIDASLLDQTRQIDGIEGGTARLIGYGLLGSEETSSGAQLTGVVPQNEDAVNGIIGRVTEGRFISDDPAMELAIGTGLAKTLRAAVGDELVVISQAADGSMANDLVTVVGLVETGDLSIDRAGAYTHLSDLQELLALEGKAHEVFLVGSDARDSDALAETVRAAVGSDALLVQSWSQASPATAQLMGMQDVGALVMLGVVFGVAALGVLNTMLMSVFERTRELGLMQALGLQPRHVMGLVLRESLLLGLLSCAIGGAIGGVLDTLLVVYGFDMSGGTGTGFDYQGASISPVIYGVVRPEGIVLTLGSVFIVSMLAAVWPALRAARLRPVDAMRQL
ncbi:MAG: putative ABC transport system permease protein [Myxococcota bacterium]